MAEHRAQSTELYWLYEFPTSVGLEVCNAYNKVLKLGWTSPMTGSIWATPKFDGAYGSPAPAVASLAIDGLYGACVSAGANRYQIFHILIIR